MTKCLQKPAGLHPSTLLYCGSNTRVQLAEPVAGKMRWRLMNRYRRGDHPSPFRFEVNERRSASQLTPRDRVSSQIGRAPLLHLTIAYIHWVDSVHQTRIRTTSPPAPSTGYRFRLPGCCLLAITSPRARTRWPLGLGCSVPPPSFLPASRQQHT